MTGNDSGFLHPFGRWQKGKIFSVLHAGLVILLFAAVAFLLAAAFAGVHFAITMGVDATVDSVKTCIGTVSAMFRGFELEGFSFYIFQRYAAATPMYSTVLNVLLFFGFFITYTLVSVAFSYLKSWKYYLGLSALALVVIGLEVDTLMLFGFKNSLPVVVSVLWLLVPVYVFSNFYSRLTFMARTGIMALVVAVFVTVVLVASEAVFPVGHFVAHAHYSFFMISMLFIWSVSYDIPFLLLFLTTDSRNAGSKSSLVNFVLANLLYLLNILLVYMYNTRVIDWDIIYINAFVLLSIGAVVGYWALRYKKDIYKDLFIQVGAGGVLYAATGLFTLLFCAYTLFHANDPGYEVLEDAVIYSHLATGILFLFYVSVEFLDLFLKKQKVHKVVFQPRKMPFAIVTVGGLVGVMAMIFYNGYFPYYQTLAAKANAVADYSLHTGARFEAEQYYKEGLAYEFQNHKSNYALGCMAAEIGDKTLAKYYFNQALLKNPLPHTYINLANVYTDDNSLFNALDVYRDGMKMFPRSYELFNNMGLLFTQTDITDSVAFYLEKSAELDKSSVAKDNLFAALTRSKVALPDSVLAPEFNGSPAAMANRLAYANFTGKDAGITEFNYAGTNDSVIDGTGVAYLTNFYLNNLAHGRAEVLDTGMLNLWLNTAANEGRHEQLNFLKAHSLYRTGNVLAGLELMDRLAATAGSAAPFYAMQSGLMYLDLGVKSGALDRLEQARYKRYREAALPAALLTLQLAESKEEALDALSHPYLLENPAYAPELADLREDTEHSHNYIINDDRRILQALLFQHKRLSQDRITFLMRSMHNGELRSLAGISLAESSMQEGNYERARQLLEEVKPLTREFALTDEQLNQSFVRLLLAEKKYTDAVEQVKESKITDEDFKEAGYIKGLDLYLKSDTSGAMKAWEKALAYHPFYAEGVVAVCELLNAGGHRELAYQLLYDRIKLADKHPVLLMNYTLQCLQMNLAAYAEESFERTKTLLTPAVAARFEKQYAAEKLKMEARFNEW